MSYVGSSTLLTDKGVVAISDCIDTVCMVWNGHSFTEVYPRIMSTDANTVHVAIEDKNNSGIFFKIECTIDQQFVLADGTVATVEQLEAGMELMPYRYPLAFHISSNGSIVIDEMCVINPVVKYTRIGKSRNNTIAYGFTEMYNQQALVNNIMIVTKSEGVN